MATICLHPTMTQAHILRLQLDTGLRMVRVGSHFEMHRNPPRGAAETQPKRNRPT